MQATTVAARGEAETDYNLAGFSVALTALSSTVPAAKAKLKIKVDELSKAMADMKTKLGLEFVKNSVRAISNVTEKHEWVKNVNEFKGYEASYNFSFQIDKMDKISEVYDTLTSLTHAKIFAPTFSLKNRDKINKKALKHAFEKVAERFETECKILGLEPTEFEIASWEASYSDSARSSRVGSNMRAAQSFGVARVMAAGPTNYSSESVNIDTGDEDSIDLIVGLASVTVNLEVGYARKALQTLKATLVKEAGAKPMKKENEHV